jgi:hypothetical protein
MQRYKDYRPSACDMAGLGLDDQQDWFVVAGRNRDSCVLAESNFASALKRLGGESDTCQVCRFGHWACGWLEIVLLSPEREAEGAAIENALADYPILDESDFSERECELEFSCWPAYGARDMVSMLVENFELGSATRDFLMDLDLDSNGALRAFHREHSTHDYEMHDEGAHYDFLYIDPRYKHFDGRLTRDELAAFLVAQRRAKRTAPPVHSVEYAAPGSENR